MHAILFGEIDEIHVLLHNYNGNHEIFHPSFLFLPQLALSQCSVHWSLPQPAGLHRGWDANLCQGPTGARELLKAQQSE